MSKVKYWYIFAKNTWNSLVFGWLILPFSATKLLELDQSGALLVCAAIVGEVLHEKKHRWFIGQVQPGLSTNYVYREVDSDNHAGKDIKITPHTLQSGSSTVNTQNLALYHLAKDAEFYIFESTRAWSLEQTMYRVERRVDYAIVVTAFVGTLLWAWG